ncbi:hypothetical protein IPM62_04705 [Candidatus Woesebacteria bacterium]|nr:MAG: hypothetical protein IPM62_04705 [Candidatus Woesebacteria bacterium]
MKKTTLFLLSTIFIFAYVLRVWYLPQKSLTFGYDQARDALQAQNIITGDFKIQGPPASTPGMHHGVFWFYYLVPPNLISGGNPVASAYWNAIFNSAVVFIVYIFAANITKNEKAGILAAFLYAISFEATQYSSWLSNPTIGIWTAPLCYLGLWLWITHNIKNKYYLAYPVMTAIGLGLSIQANIFLLYHIVPLFIWLNFARKKISVKSMVYFLIPLTLTLSSFIVSEAKFGFKSFSGVLSILTSQDSIIASKKLGDFIILFFNQLGNVYAYNSYPGNIGYGGVFILMLIVISIYTWKKSKNTSISWEPFLAIWLMAHLTVVTVGGTATPFLLVGIGPAVAIIMAVCLYMWYSEGKKIFVCIIVAIVVFGNLNMIKKENPKGQTIFSIQKEMTLAKQISALDYMYAESEGKQFSVNSLTSPLWINIVWSYLFEWYGDAQYGYVPFWHGKGQEGQLTALPSVDENVDKYFLIIEPMGGIPMRYLDETLAEENSKSRLVDEKYWGELRVQEREKIK